MDARPHAFGSFRVRAAIGAGQFGHVYRGYDPSTDRPVLIRTFELPELTGAAMARTALLASLRRLCNDKLEHPDIARPLDCGVEREVPFLVLELFVGFVQALVFAMLTTVFIGIAVEHH